MRIRSPAVVLSVLPPAFWLPILCPPACCPLPPWLTGDLAFPPAWTPPCGGYLTAVAPVRPLGCQPCVDRWMRERGERAQIPTGPASSARGGQAWEEASSLAAPRSGRRELIGTDARLASYPRTTVSQSINQSIIRLQPRRRHYCYYMDSITTHASADTDCRLRSPSATQPRL